MAGGALIYFPSSRFEALKFASHFWKVFRMGMVGVKLEGSFGCTSSWVISDSCTWLKQRDLGQRFSGVN